MFGNYAKDHAYVGKQMEPSSIGITVKR
jgi:hypothetical protein